MRTCYLSRCTGVRTHSVGDGLRSLKCRLGIRDGVLETTALTRSKTGRRKHSMMKRMKTCCKQTYCRKHTQRKGKTGERHDSSRVVSSTLHTTRLFLHLAPSLFFRQSVDRAVQPVRVVIRHIEGVHALGRQLVVAIDEDKGTWLGHPILHPRPAVFLPEQEGCFQASQFLSNALRLTMGARRLRASYLALVAPPCRRNRNIRSSFLCV